MHTACTFVYICNCVQSEDGLMTVQLWLGFK